MLKKIFLVLQKILFPNQCLHCSKNIDGVFCQECWQKLQFISKPCCSICCHPFEFGNADDHLICAKCLTKPYHFKQLITLFCYNDIIAKIISAFKYQDQLFLAKKLALLLKPHLAYVANSCHLITVVPLHHKKLRSRKFNQSILLAKYLLDKQQFAKFIPDLLIRNHHTKSQISLNKKQRQQNLKKAFTIHPKKQNLVKNKKILIIDDVFTTGATINNCALVLKKNGAEEVFIATIAKTVNNAKYLSI